MQLTLDFMKDVFDPTDTRLNRIKSHDHPFHDWYRFVLSFPPHLVSEYMERFDLSAGTLVLDPFCGTGTTLVQAKKVGIDSIGIEAHPMAYFASKVKIEWSIDPDFLINHALEIYNNASNKLKNENNFLRKLSDEQEALLLKNSINEIPLNKCLLLLEEINKGKDITIKNIEKLALAHVLVYSASNLQFGPEVGVRRVKKKDAPVFEAWIHKIKKMARDLAVHVTEDQAFSNCILGDSRKIGQHLTGKSIDAVITSPPYPNEKDYTRTTRLESVILGFINSKKELRSLKQNLIRSNTRNVYVSDNDDLFIKENSRINHIAREIERRRLALNKNSGFEKQYHNVVKLYFGGMKSHFEQIKPILKPGAKLAYVVGDQASFLQVMIRTGEILAEIANDLNYNVLSLDLFRTRQSTITGEQLREEILVLEWTGEQKMRKNKKNRYDLLIEKVFFNNYSPGSKEVSFEREEFISLAEQLNITLPKNLGDIIYSYRFRNKLPEKILNELSEGEEWIIRLAGKGKYVFVRSLFQHILPNPRLSKIKILDSTPEIIRRYAFNDEQALLAIIRYNRLIDTFTSVTCYSLQNHLRTTVTKIGQVETDEIYIGVNKQREQFAFTVQAKGMSEQLSIVQIEQDFELCKQKFPSLTCRPVAAQMMDENLIALFEFEDTKEGLMIKEEKHYKIVLNSDLSDDEIISLRSTR